jgi:hypothetical protein
VECDFVEELEQYQLKQRQLHLDNKSAAAASTDGGVEQPGAQGQQALAGQEQDYDYLTCKYSLTLGLREDVDFYLLPVEAWQALHSWYGGGPPLPRFLFNSMRFRSSVPCMVGQLLQQHSPSKLIYHTAAAPPAPSGRCWAGVRAEER